MGRFTFALYIAIGCPIAMLDLKHLLFFLSLHFPS